MTPELMWMVAIFGIARKPKWEDHLVVVQR
jgi:hypothetical protein